MTILSIHGCLKIILDLYRIKINKYWGDPSDWGGGAGRENIISQVVFLLLFCFKGLKKRGELCVLIKNTQPFLGVVVWKRNEKSF